MNFDFDNSSLDDESPIISSNDMFEMDLSGDLYNRIDEYSSLNLRTGNIRNRYRSSYSLFEDEEED